MSYFCIIYALLGILIIISSLILILNINSIHRIAYLIFIFILSSFIMIFLNFKYLGLTYIIVYVGAIMIIFMFIIMMIDLQDKDIKFTSNIITKENPVIYYFKSANINNLPISDQSLLEIFANNKPDSDNIVNLFSSDSNLFTRLKKSFIFKFTIFFFILFLFQLIINLTGITSDLGFNPIFQIFNFNFNILTFFYPFWYNSFYTFTDLNTLALILFQAYSVAIVLISLVLWAVLIGIIKITQS